MKGKEFVLMIGLPRSGKSTYVDRFLSEYQLVCPDDIRKGLGVKHDRRLEPFVWAVVEAQLRALMERGRPVVLDATNTVNQARSKWIGLAKDYGYEVRLVWIDTPLSVCLDRAKQDGFPESVLLRMYHQLKKEPPDESCSLYKLERIPYESGTPDDGSGESRGDCAQLD
ncbi:ATP-binding protein [Thermodesulforhabdus norvegica]|uniref:Predicted kinase n=1 Tax=Thermodesulforhabdus norvegica TaxID=39841 RepID=A0A1I4RH14_9BACT|nr:ATP-binding protein [Thermodesulforhabdus norvegica]SFM51529.1 Predicted kinase [Thermodesulforhabdus norvegica]